MPSERAEIGPNEIKKAKDSANSRLFTSSDPLIIADVVERGLSLRVQGAAVSWILKFNGRSKSLGSVAEIRTATTAREVAAKVRATMRDGGDVNAYLISRRAGNDHEKATNKAEAITARAVGRWTWRDLATHYCDEYLSKPRHTARGRREPSLQSAAISRRYLTMAECEPLFDRLLSDLRPGDLEEIRDACAKANRKTSSRQFISAAKAALSYARKKHSRIAGLEGVSKWWLDVEALDSTIPEPRNRHPSLTELARILYVAENVRRMPGRTIDRVSSETVLAGLWFLAFTGQRTTAGLSLQKEHILPWNEPRTWKVAYFPADIMKGRRPFSLPIPPRVALVFERAATDSNPDSAFAFPATRRSGENSDAPLSRSSVSTLIDRLRGRSSDPKAGQEFDGPNLLDGIPHFSPHDFRRTFATTCSDLSVRGDAISAVLDHADVTTGQAPIRTADITRTAYDYSQKLDLKRQAIMAWTDALFAACDKEWAKHRPRRGLLRVAPIHEPWYETMEREKATAKPKINLAKLRAVDESDPN